MFKSLYRLVALCILGAMIAAGSAQAFTAAQWHAMTQLQRNQLILQRAYQDNNRQVGLNCKQWVQVVVPSASAYAVTVPQTNPSPYDWYWLPGQYVVQVSQPYSILWAWARLLKPIPA